MPSFYRSSTCFRGDFSYRWEKLHIYPSSRSVASTSTKRGVVRLNGHAPKIPSGEVMSTNGHRANRGCPGGAYGYTRHGTGSFLSNGVRPPRERVVSFYIGDRSRSSAFYFISDSVFESLAILKISPVFYQSDSLFEHYGDSREAKIAKNILKRSKLKKKKRERCCTERYRGLSSLLVWTT